MTEWNDQLVVGGSGFVAYRLMVEGWPHEWVTDPAVLHQQGIGARQVFPGLQYDGLRIGERAVLRDAWPEVDGMTVTIVPSDANEDTVNGFTRDPKVVAVLTADLDASAITWETRRTLGLGIYYLGSETVLANGDNILRGFWDSEPQDHAIVDYSQDNPVPIYDWPPTMEGRRAYLYAYGPGDDPSSDGQIIWRGVVLRPPRMDSDGLSWQIEIGPITAKFDQNVGASEEFEYKVRGVYHSQECPLRIGWEFFGPGGDGTLPPTLAYGFYETQDQWASHVTTLLTDVALPEATGVATGINGIIVFRFREGRYEVYIPFLSADDDFFVAMAAADALDGCIDIGSQGTPGSNPCTTRTGGITYYGGDPAGKWVLAFSTYPTPMAYPLPPARTMVGSAQFDKPWEIPQTASLLRPYAVDDDAFPSNRVYLEKVDGLQIDDVLMVRNGDDAAPRMMRVTGINALETERWILVELIGDTGPLYITSESSIIPVRVYADDGNWADFMNGVVEQSHSANLGKTPWITDRDVDTSLWPGYWDAFPFLGYWRHRVYQFSKQVRVRDVLAPELMATGWMARLAADGRLDVAPMPFISGQRSANWTLTDDEILLPADEMAGMWPTWEAQSDGLVNIVKLRLGYQPNDDDFDEAQDYTVRITQSIAEHKSGDRALQEIEIRSQPANIVTVPVRVGSVSIRLTRRYTVTTDVITAMALPYLRTLSADYAIVTVAVPFTLFGVLVGDILEVTSQYLPDGLGGRGVTSKKAICVGRTWNLDPKAGEMGTLTIWFARDSGRVAGYAPTGRVTDQSDLGGNLWTLTFDAANARQLAWAEDQADGLIAKHFAVDDAVQLVQNDSLSPTIIRGVVTAKPDTTHLAVQLEGTWTPGSSVWDLRYMRIEEGPTRTAHQAAYCHINNADGDLIDPREFA